MRCPSRRLRWGRCRRFSGLFIWFRSGWHGRSHSWTCRGTSLTHLFAYLSCWSGSIIPVSLFLASFGYLAIGFRRKPFTSFVNWVTVLHLVEKGIGWYVDACSRLISRSCRGHRRCFRCRMICRLRRWSNNTTPVAITRSFAL